MSREQSSTFFTFLFSLLIFVSISEIQGRKIQQGCLYSCGDMKNIGYPFHLKGHDRVACGDPPFELSCQSNRTVLELYSGQYYVKNISYEKNIINVVDVNLANGSCSLPYKSVPRNFFDYIPLDSTYTYVSYVNCTRNITDPAYASVPCLSGNQSHIYLNYGGYRVADLSKSCAFISMVPILYHEDLNYPSFETIQKLLESGFELQWSVKCRRFCIPYGPLSCDFVLKYCITREKSLEIYNKIKFKLMWIEGIWPFVALLVGRFILAPIVLVLYLIHTYRTTWKTVDKVEKFLDNQQSWMPKRYSYHEIMAVTNNFRDKLGQGGFGSVYRGQLHTGCLIAVKLLESSKFSAEEFINEVSTIGRIHHVNVVQLLGFCSDGSKRALVYEYMPNGSLDKHIFLKEGRGISLNWEKLHEIALGIARGIEYLHGGCDTCILHFDIKPHNILLDNSFIPKVSDFGLAKFYPKENDFVSISATRGTIGYIAPELISRNFGAISCKSDVYSFGMVLLEMSGGRRNSFLNATRSSKAYFPSWVYDQINNGGDLELRNVTEIEAVIARKLCIIGLWCIQVKPTDRPSMTRVIEMLEGSIDDLQMPPKPFFSSSHQHNSIGEMKSDSSTGLLVSESVSEECLFDDGYV